MDTYKPPGFEDAGTAFAAETTFATLAAVC